MVVSVCVSIRVLSVRSRHLCVLSLVFATVMSPVLPMCIFISCSSVLCAPMALCMSMSVKTMPSLISVMSPPPWLCSLSVS